MDEQRWYFYRVGMLVLIAILAMSILTVMFSDVFQSQYVIYIRLNEAPGVQKDTPIRKNGITIGRVKAVELEADKVLLTCGIDSNRRIYNDEICQIKTSNFLGDAELAFLNGRVPEGEIRQSLPPQSVVTRYAVAPNPLEIVDVILDLKANVADTLTAVTDAGKSIKTTSDNVGQITGLVRDVLVDNEKDFSDFLKNAQRISNKSELAIDNFNSVMGNVNDLVGNPELKGDIGKSVKKIPELLESAEKTLAEVRDTISPFKNVGDKVDVNLKQIEAFTKSLGEEGPLVIGDIRKSVAKIETLVDNVETFTKQFRNSNGTIGKLFNDPQVYERLNATLGNIERISVEVQPLVADFRLFADSLARDPAQLGVKGALQRTSGAGSKGSLLGRNPFSGSDRQNSRMIDSTWSSESSHQAIDYSTAPAGTDTPWENQLILPEIESSDLLDEPCCDGMDAVDPTFQLQRPRLFPPMERPLWRPMFPR